MIYNVVVKNIGEGDVMKVFLKIIGYILIIIGILDFAGMFLGFDFTGVAWSPIVFGIVGGLLVSARKKKQD